MIYTGNHRHGEQIMRAAGGGFSSVTMQVISRFENGKLFGGVVYENYTGDGGSLIAHIAGFTNNWLNRDLLWIIFDYPFNQLKCEQVFCQIPGKNNRSLKLCKSMGFEEVIRLEGVFPDDDMILLRLRRDDCRFLKLKPRSLVSKKDHQSGQTESTPAA